MKFLEKLLRKEPQTAVDAAEIRTFFNQAASDEEHFPSTIDPRIWHVKVVLDHLGNVNGKRVADVGCGKGRFARIVKDQNPSAQVVAIDLAEEMLRYVPAGIQKVAGTMTAIPIASESCDGVYATESLEHAVDIPGAIAELARIVKPGGRIVIIDKNAEAWGRLETPHWERWFGRRELERLLKRHCRPGSSQIISHWEDGEPDGLFLPLLAGE